MTIDAGPLLAVGLGGVIAAGTQYLTSMSERRSRRAEDDRRLLELRQQRNRDATVALMESVALLADVLNDVGRASEQLDNLSFAEHLTDASRHVSRMHRTAYPRIYAVDSRGLVAEANATYETIGRAFANWAESIVNHDDYDEAEVTRARLAMTVFMESAREAVVIS